MLPYRCYLQGLKDISRDQVIIINVFCPHLCIQFPDECSHVTWLVFKFYEPFVIAFPIEILHLGRNSEFPNANMLLISRYHQCLFDFFSNYMLTKSRNEMLDPSCNNKPVRCYGYKFDGVTNIISPK